MQMDCSSASSKTSFLELPSKSKHRSIRKQIVQEYIMENETFSRSGNTYCNEGGDFTTATENKHIKGHLDPGVPSIVHWVKASRNHEMLQRNSHSVFKKLNLKDPNLQKAQFMEQWPSG